MKWIMILLFIFQTQVKAEEDLLNPEPLHLKAGASLNYYRYVEPALISQTGFLIGAWLNWDYRLAFYRGVVQGDLLNGQLTYDGALCQVNTGQCSDYKGKTNELIFKLAHRFSFDVNENFALFAGLGYRYLYDKGVGSGFYQRTGKYTYVPLGLTSRLALNAPAGFLVFDAEYDYFLSGGIESKMSDVNSTYGDLHHKQNKGYAMKLTLGFEEEKKPEDLPPWFYGVYFEKWSIPKSENSELLISGAASGKFYYEPENYSETLGLQVGFSY